MKRKSEILGRHPSSSNPTKSYLVKRVSEADGRVWLGCNCPAFTTAKCWRGVPACERDCKHTALHRLNDPAIATDDPVLQPNIAFGNVGQVTRQDNMILLPLIPLNGMGTDIMATAIYDCVTEHRIPWGTMRDRYKAPRQWSWPKVKRHVEHHGRVTYDPPKHALGTATYYRTPVPIYGRQDNAQT